MKTLYISLIAILIGGTAFTFIAADNWKSNTSDSNVSFSGGKVNGSFSGVQSEAIIDDENPEKSSISATIDANSINTGNVTMDEHALSETGLNGAKFKTISFQSKTVVKKDNQYFATGDLTLKGVTKSITIPFSFTSSGENGELNGKFEVVPSEYGVTRGGTPSVATIGLKISYKK